MMRNRRPKRQDGSGSWFGKANIPSWASRRVPKLGTEACQNPQRGGRKPSSAAHTRQGGVQRKTQGWVGCGWRIFEPHFDRYHVSDTQAVKRKPQQADRQVGACSNRGEKVDRQNGVFFLTSRELTQDRNEKKKRMAGQTSIDTHPA